MVKLTEAQIEVLRLAAHEAPMNKVFTDHKGRKFLATHSMAWAEASRAWAAGRALLKEVVDGE